MLKTQTTKETSRADVVFHSPFFVPGTLALLTLALFFGLFSESGVIASGAGGDLTRYFAYYREFGAAQMRTGHIPLWNPHVCGGRRSRGTGSRRFSIRRTGFICFCRWRGPSIWKSRCHVFLTGYFASLWAKRQGFHPLAQLLAGVMTMFGAAYYLHVFAGHLSLLDACAWVPLLLLALEETAKRPARSGRLSEQSRWGWKFWRGIRRPCLIRSSPPRCIRRFCCGNRRKRAGPLRVWQRRLSADWRCRLSSLGQDLRRRQKECGRARFRIRSRFRFPLCRAT